VAQAGGGIGVVVERRRISVGVADDRGVVRYRHTAPIADSDSRTVVDERLASVIAAARDAARDLALESDVVCIAVPGEIAGDPQHVVRSPLPLWVGWSARSLASDAEIVLVSAAHAGAAAEAARGSTDFVYILGCAYGVSAVRFADGRICTQNDGRVGDLGHLTVVNGGVECICGARGCLTAEFTHLLAAARGADRDGASSLPAALDAGSVRATRLVRQLGVQLAGALAAIARVVDPERVILAGIHAEILPWIGAEVAAVIEHAVAGARLGSVEAILPGAPMADAVLAGAARIACDQEPSSPLSEMIRPGS